MAGRRPDRRHEAAAATLELTVLAAALCLLLAAVADGMRDGGDPLGARIAGRLERAVAPIAGRAAPGTPGGGAGERPEAVQEAVALPFEGRRRGSRERRWGGGVPARVSREDLRMAPLLHPRAAWHARRATAARRGRLDASGTAQACALCAALEWSHELRSGAAASGRGGQLGTAASVRGEGRLALASAQGSARAGAVLGALDVGAQLRLAGTLGAEADAEASAALGRSVQELQLDGGAVVGAVARAEARVGVQLLGVAVRQGGRAEGWAGAGARGTLGLRRAPGRLEWRLGWGAALGLGGAAEWNGSIDVAQVPRRHRRLARRTMRLAVRAGLAATPGMHAFATLQPQEEP